MQNTSLEELLRQKKELEGKIRELRGASISAGCASVQRNQNYKDMWSLMITKQYFGEAKTYVKKPVRSSVVDSYNREDVINAIPGIISDLQSLYKEVCGNADE